MKIRRGSLGFTLVESMVTLTVASILMAVAVPSFQDSTLNSRLRSTANTLVASAHLARSEAFKRNAVVTLCVSADGSTCSGGDWEQGWIVRAPDGVTVLDAQPALPAGYKVIAAGGTTTLQFQPTGAGTTTASFQVCRATPASANQRAVTIDAAGRAMATPHTSSSCS